MQSRGTDPRNAPAPSPEGEAVARGAVRGFSARLNGASLFDLMQIECFSRARKVVRVISEGRGAMLFFRDGRLIHATAGRLSGEAAVAEVLAWGEGIFEPCEAAWPATDTISASLEHVLLRAAQAVDEGKVVALPVREPDTKSERVEPMTKPRVPFPGLTSADVELWVRLSADGELVEHQGTGGEELADAVAYAAQLIDLVGELLGLDRFGNLELAFARGKCLIHREPGGGVLALKPGRGSSIEALREKLGVAV